MKFAVRQK